MSKIEANPNGVHVEAFFNDNEQLQIHVNGHLSTIMSFDDSENVTVNQYQMKSM